MEGWEILIETSNAAFEDTPATELARILRRLADDFEQLGEPAASGKLRDVNGNTVGFARMKRLHAIR